MRTQPRQGSRNAWTVLAAGGAVIGFLVTVPGCGASSGTTAQGPSAPTTTSAPTTGSTSPTPSVSSGPAGAGNGSSGPAVVESNPPGDIPDNQAFVPYAGHGFTVTIPEGWARSSGVAVVFSDKYNNITVSSAPAAHPPTIASTRTIDLTKIKAASHGFAPGAISTVQRKAGTAVLVTYHAYSAVNPVTGKVADEAVERYTFWRSGTAVTLTLAAPVGSDNVDPWRTVTDSFTWTK